MVHIGSLGYSAGNGSHGMGQGYCHQDGQERQEYRVQELPDVDDQFRRLQREQQSCRHEQESEPCQEKCLVPVDKGYDPDLIGNSGRPGQSKGRPDGEIQQHRKDPGKDRMHIPGQFFQAAAARKAESNQGQEGHQHPGGNETDIGTPEMRAGQLAHMYRKDQVPGSKEHPEQHGTYKKIFCRSQFMIHGPLLIWLSGRRPRKRWLQS